MDNSLRDRVTQIVARSELLQKKGRYLESIQLLEQVVALKSSALGSEHPEVLRAVDKLAELLNVTAMSLIQKGERMDTALDMLKRAESKVRSLPMKAVTLNNLGCYYRKTGKLRAAMGFLVEALATELKADGERTLADTHLNMCAVLSQLSKHDEAILHAMMAIIFLQEEFLKVALPAAAPDLTEERLAVLAIAYHNLGVEFEHVKRYDESIKIYRRAHDIAEKYAPSNEQLIGNMSKVLESATQQFLTIRAKPRRQQPRAAAHPPTHQPNEQRSGLPKVRQSAERVGTRRSFFKRAVKRPGQSSHVDSRLERIELDEGGWVDRY